MNDYGHGMTYDLGVDHDPAPLLDYVCGILGCEWSTNDQEELERHQIREHGWLQND
jgi:hypothetical protein